jgi:broad specificity phosphatase PhoE
MTTSSSARIVLVRHGKSAHVHDGRWYRHHEVKQFESAYDAAGIRDDSHPSSELKALAAKADVLCASDMIRAIASAQRLAPGRQVAVSPLIREIKLEPPSWIPFNLPLDVWDSFSAAQWTYRLAVGANNEFTDRAVMGVDWLVAHASGTRTVVAVTHGGFRRILAHRLLARRWQAAAPNRSFENWSAWEFTFG